MVQLYAPDYLAAAYAVFLGRLEHVEAAAVGRTQMLDDDRLELADACSAGRSRLRAESAGDTQWVR